MPVIALCWNAMATPMYLARRKSPEKSGVSK
jgi:hypothetical protein